MLLMNSKTRKRRYSIRVSSASVAIFPLYLRRRYDKRRGRGRVLAVLAAGFYTDSIAEKKMRHSIGK